jgi:hypothetical protein
MGYSQVLVGKCLPGDIEKYYLGKYMLLLILFIHGKYIFLLFFFFLSLKGSYPNLPTANGPVRWSL